jgi:predicted RNA binding protein YcfA (HicA-like mRNA interferase family)
VKSAELLRILRRRATRLGLEHEEIGAKGSHVKVRHGGRVTVIPMHRTDIPTGTYRAILKQLGLTRSDLEE